MKKPIVIAVVIGVAAAVLCRWYFFYRPVEQQILAHIGIDEFPLGTTVRECIEVFGEPVHVPFGQVNRLIAGKPADNPYKGSYDMVTWHEKGIIAFSNRDQNDLGGKFRDSSNFRITNIIVPARWEFVLLKLDGSTQKILMKSLVPIQVGGKPLYEFTPKDFRRMYPFMREEKPGLYTMGKYPFAINYTVYFSGGELQFFQINKEFSLLEGL